MDPNTEGHRDLCRRNLASRRDLTSFFAKEMDGTASPALYEKLMETPAHRKLVEDGVVTGFNQEIDGMRSRLVLSPAISAMTLETLFDTHKNENVETSRVVSAHQNAARKIVTETLGALNPSTAYEFATNLIANQSPHAEYALGEIKYRFHGSKVPTNVGTLEAASKELLMSSEKELREEERWEGLACVMCNSNFPWGECVHPASELQKGARPAHYMAIQSARAIAGAIKPSDFEAAISDKDEAMALLFAPNISSPRLGKLAEAHPEIAPLVAIHPNGFDVSTKDFSPEVRLIVDGIRCAPLAGHSSGASKESSHVLVL